ncbi:hypothetical protein SGFS_055960 [Streptomyces graminofaciens]|uniref:Uncharacterized protein n=1 Tax=Streptomyces graminofaciens TaxID=68212 RepID=A0ABN5VLH2_9ACTN|nr:hypothetical protein SGFS_055960 [Streptomyces graminofaciens]
MYARRGDGDTDLAGARPGVLDLLIGEVLGRAEGVQADGVHGGLLGAVWRMASAAVIAGIRRGECVRSDAVNA